MAERECRQCTLAGGQCTRRAADPRHDAEPVQQYRRRRIAMDRSYRATGQHDGLCCATLVPGRRDRRCGCGEHCAGGNLGSRCGQCHASLHAKRRRQSPRRPRSRLQHVEFDDQAGHQVRRPPCRRSGQHVQPDRTGADPGYRYADRVVRRHLRTLGRLQRDDAGSRRLHVLVHK